MPTRPDGYQLTTPRPEHFGLIRGVEVAAAERFSFSDLPEPLRSHMIPPADLFRAKTEGRLWATLAPGHTPVGFAMVEPQGDAMHLLELSVHPAHGRRGLASWLLDHVADCARSQSLSTLTLTTYRHVPWNAPFFEARGFVEIPEPSLSTYLREALDREIQAGLHAEHRIAMARTL